MVPMRRGCRLVSSALGLTLVAAPTLTGCGLFDGGSNVEDVFEYVPANTFQVRFSDRGVMAERLGVDDVDPRDVSDGEIDDYLEALADEGYEGEGYGGDDVPATGLTDYVKAMQDAPLNDFDIEWEAYAAWGDDPADPDGEVHVWKVGDEVDFEDLADDLEDKGYDEERSSGFSVYSADPAAIDRRNTVDGVYPAVMRSALLDQDDRLVVASYAPEPLAAIAEVIADDRDSLADDGGMDDLLDAAGDDPEVAWLTSAGPSLCSAREPALPDELRAEYDDLGRPSARAIFVPGDDAPPLLALLFDSEDAAEDDRAARERLVRGLTDLGDFEVSRDGALVVIEEDFTDGAEQALEAESLGTGPGFCRQEADD